MPIVYNPTQETVSTKMQGAWFTFKPGAMKRMDEEKARFITENRKETGLTILPAPFEGEDGAFNTDYSKTELGKAQIEECKKAGINSMLEYYRSIVRNNQVAMRKDLAAKYPEGDTARMVALEMSSGEMKALEILSKYQSLKSDANDAKIKEISRLLEAVGPIGE